MAVHVSAQFCVARAQVVCISRVANCAPALLSKRHLCFSSVESLLANVGAYVFLPRESQCCLSRERDLFSFLVLGLQRFEGTLWEFYGEGSCDLQHKDAFFLVLDYPRCTYLCAPHD